MTALDGRPLMVLRRNTDVDEEPTKVQKLLTAALKSERFQLASKWFQCVEVDDAVLEEDHPYHLLFSQKRPPALLLASPDGKRIVHFLSRKSQKVTWTGISSVLKASYKGDPTKTIKALEKLLCDFDALDARRKELNTQIERCKEKKDTAKLKTLEAKMAKQEKAREEALAEEKRLRALVLRSKKKDKKGKTSG
ncbi:MAG: hypothetical protein ACYTGW_18605 [Planctomycetota bacterium]